MVGGSCEDIVFRLKVTEDARQCLIRDGLDRL